MDQRVADLEAYVNNGAPLAFMGAGGLIGNYLVQTAPRFAPRWRANSFWQRADSGLRF